MSKLKVKIIHFELKKKKKRKEEDGHSIIACSRGRFKTTHFQNTSFKISLFTFFEVQHFQIVYLQKVKKEVV